MGRCGLSSGVLEKEGDRPLRTGPIPYICEICVICGL